MGTKGRIGLQSRLDPDLPCVEGGLRELDSRGWLVAAVGKGRRPGGAEV